MGSIVIDHERCEIEATDVNGAVHKVVGYTARTILDAWDGEDPDFVRQAVIADQKWNADLEKLRWR